MFSNSDLNTSKHNRTKEEIMNEMKMLEEYGDNIIKDRNSNVNAQGIVMIDQNPIHSTESSVNQDI